MSSVEVSSWVLSNAKLPENEFDGTADGSNKFRIIAQS